MYNSFIILLALAALLTFINSRYLKLPLTIGLMILGITLSIILMLVKHFLPDFFVLIPDIVHDIDFKNFLMNGILSFLMFAGSVRIDLKELSVERISVFMFSIFGTAISTLIIGTLTYLVFNLLELNISLLYCMLFGALISPTDPIAVMAIFKNFRIRKDISIKIEGESLFNDGIGIVIFLTVLNLINGGSDGFLLSKTALLFLREVGGGIAFGIIIGWISLQFLKELKQDADSGVMATLVVATGGYAMANILEVSGVLAMVAAGLTIGNWVNKNAEEETKKLISGFWEVIDSVFNSSLFVLMGMAIVLVDSTKINIIAAVCGIIIVLIARFVSVSIPYFIVDKSIKKFPWIDIKTVTVMTWSGLRGALAFALALSLVDDPHGNFIIFLTYCVVAFSIIVQGLTIPSIVKAMKWQ